MSVYNSRRVSMPLKTIELFFPNCLCFLTSRTSSKAPSISSGATDKFMARTRASISLSNASRLPDSISSLSRSLSCSYANANSANSFSCCWANKINSLSSSSSSGRSRSTTSLTPAARASSLWRLKRREKSDTVIKELLSLQIVFLVKP